MTGSILSYNQEDFCYAIFLYMNITLANSITIFGWKSVAF
jgi:hypothetical protein